MPGAEIITDDIIREYAETGVAFIPQALSKSWLKLIELGFNRNMKNPGPYAKWHYEGHPGAFYDDFCNFWSIPEYRMLLKDSPIGDIMRKVLKTENLWLYYDQIFPRKPAPGCRRHGTRTHPTG